MNEVFGEENYIESLKWKRKKQPSFLAKHTAQIMEYVLIYSKNAHLLEKLSIEGTSDSTKKVVNLTNQYSERVFKPGVIIKKGGDGIIKKGNYTIKTMDIEYLDDLEYLNGVSTNSVKVKAQFSVSQDKINDYISQGLLLISKNYGLRRNVSEEEIGKRKSITDLLLDWGDNQDSDNEMKELFSESYFDYTKPTKLLSNLANSIFSEDSIILDFFAGSASTAHAITNLNKEDGGNRKYICVQLPELCDEKSEAYKAGYKTIADIAKERIRRVIGKINEEKETLGKETATLMEKVAELQQQIEELKKNQPASIFNDGKQSPEIEKLIKQKEAARDKANENIEKMDKIDQCDKGFKVLKLNDSNFKQWLQINGKDAKALEEQMKLFIDPVAENATIENMVYELLLKSGKDLNCKIEHATNYFKINENELVFMLEKATQEIIDAVLKEKPLKVVALDKLFKGNDQLKTNTVLQMKDAGVEFKTI
jgi:hypothetical protein